MSLQDRLAAHDATQLLGLGAALSLVYSSSTRGVTNFALFLFGIVAHEMHSSTVPFRQFLTLVLFTGFFDLLALPSMPFFSISSICALMVMLLKIPIFFTCLNTLRERGGDLRFGPGAGFTMGNARSNLPHWSMPGSFAGPQQTSQSHSAATAPPPPGAFPSSGGFRLGGDEDDHQTSGGPPAAPAPGRNGYHTIA